MDVEALKRALSDLLEKANDAATANPIDAINMYQNIIKSENVKDDDIVKIKEEAVYKVGDLYAKQGRSQDLSTLLTDVRPFFTVTPKAKTAKIVRTIIDLVGKIPNTTALQIELCRDSIEWTKSEKRTFLRQRIESRLAELYFNQRDYTSALPLINNLLREVRRLDDKALLVEIQLLESQVYHALKNLAKAKAALTSARTAANSIYCPPLLQAEIDMQAGILHSDDKDYKTGYSYFFEAFEGYNSLDNPNAVMCLKYMLMCKIMINSPDDVNAILSGKNALRYSGAEVEAMRAIATAYQERSLHSFENALRRFKKELADDPIINTHLAELYDNLLEQHLIRIIEPYSRVQVTHVAALIALPVEKIESKLSQMILDKKLNGILDQGDSCLIVFDDKKADKLYPNALKVVENMSSVVDSLFERANTLAK